MEIEILLVYKLSHQDEFVETTDFKIVESVCVDKNSDKTGIIDVDGMFLVGLYAYCGDEIYMMYPTITRDIKSAKTLFENEIHKMCSTITSEKMNKLDLTQQSLLVDISIWAFLAMGIENEKEVEQDIQQVIPEFAFNKLTEDKINGLDEISNHSKRFINLVLHCAAPIKRENWVIEYPEHGLHPTTIKILIKYLELASQKCELFLITNSEQLWKTNLNIAGFYSEFYVRYKDTDETVLIYQATKTKFILLIKSGDIAIEKSLATLVNVKNKLSERYNKNFELNKMGN